MHGQISHQLSSFPAHSSLSDSFSTAAARKARESRSGYGPSLESPTVRPMDRRSQFEQDDDLDTDNLSSQELGDDDEDGDDFFDASEDLIRMRSATSSSAALGALRRRSFVPATPTANSNIAVAGLAGDDLPGAKARKVLGLDSEGWEIGPGSSESPDGHHSGSATGALGRGSTSRRATARMTALLNGGSSSSSSSSAAAATSMDGLPQSSAASGASTSRRHSLLPAMLGLGSRRPTVTQAQLPSAQPSVYSADIRLSPNSITPFSGASAGPSSAAASGGSNNSTSYFLAAPGTSGLPASTSLPLNFSGSTLSPRYSVDASGMSGLNGSGSSANTSGSNSSPATKGLKKVRGRKQNSHNTTSSAISDEATSSVSSRGVGAVSLADAQDWERALENAERNASWYSSIAHRPRPRPPPSGQPTTGTPVPRAGSTSSASSTPTTDQSHHSLFYAGSGTSISGPVLRSGSGTASLGPDGVAVAGLGIGLGVGNGAVRRSASTSNLMSPTTTGLPSPTHYLASVSHCNAAEQEEELLDEASALDTEGGDGESMGGGLPLSAYPHLHVHASLGSPVRSQSAAGFTSASKSGEVGALRSPNLGPSSTISTNRYSTVSNAMVSPERFGQPYGSYGAGTRGSRYSFATNTGSVSSSANPGRQRRPSNDPHPLPPSIVSGAPQERDRDRRPSLGNEHLASTPGWDLVAGSERMRSGSFGSAVTPGSIFVSSLGNNSNAGGATRTGVVGPFNGPAQPYAAASTTPSVGPFSQASAATYSGSRAPSVPLASSPSPLTSPVTAGPSLERRASKVGVIVVQLDERVQTRLVGAPDRKPRDSTDMDENDPGGGDRGYVEGKEDDEGGAKAAGQDVLKRPGRESVLVGDAEVDGALGRAFRLYSAQLDGDPLEEDASAPISNKSVNGAALRSGRTREDSEVTQVGSSDSVLKDVNTTPTTASTTSNVPRTPRGIPVDQLESAMRPEDAEPSQSTSAPVSFEEGHTEDSDFGDALYREMYARGLSSDLPRPVSVYSGSQTDEEEEDPSWRE
ncbi:hypothetical protein CF327_g3703 [Tilletia walkeri]|nr:hypothetical protein CF327_g3703 [Tilletia walkeri]